MTEHPATTAAEVLGVCRASLPEAVQLSAEDDLFAAGATSLTMLRIRARLREDLRLDVPLGVLFQTPNAAAITMAAVPVGDEVLATTQAELRPGEPAPLSYKQAATIRRLEEFGHTPQALLSSLIRVPARAIDADRLRAALTELWAQQPSLRMLMRPDATAVWSEHPEPHRTPLTVHRVPNDHTAMELAEQLVSDGFGWGQVLFAVDLICGEDADLLLVRLEHLIADGRGFQIFQRSLAMNYNSSGVDQCTGIAHLATLEAFNAREEVAMNGPETATLVDTVRAVSLRPSLPLQFTALDPPRKTETRLIDRQLSPTVVRSFFGYARREKVSPFVAALAFMVENVVGDGLSGVLTQVDNRSTDRDQQVIGWLSNRVPVKVSPHVNSVRSVQQAVAAAIECGMVPYPFAVSRLDDINPANFDAPAMIFQYLEDPPTHSLWGPHAQTVALPARVAPSADVHVEVRISGTDARIRVMWSSEFCDDRVIQHMTDRLCDEARWDAFTAASQSPEGSS